MPVDQLRDRFGVEPVCRVLDRCPGTYYGRKHRPPSARAQRDAVLIEEIEAVHQASHGTCGAYRVHKQLRRQGMQVARCTVERLMRAHGLQGVHRRDRRRTTTPDESAPRPPDLVNRQFTADRPDRLWLADITYVRTWEGLVYVACLLDVFSRRIVGRSRPKLRIKPKTGSTKSRRVPARVSTRPPSP
ncbi:HTH-like domain-containing protein [Actinomadura madurae]|uniref:HTH-like domain-containing protein n=2 Tax=Actinomadura madurae TaxID=1993 RepID=A0A1I5S9H7_9ACTN|nr:HTH-like domain-containing protein [Actinomadura madurae]